MARKIKLPLDMGNDIKVRDIEELKANYNSEKVVEALLNGQLLTWCKERYYDEEAKEVEKLSVEENISSVSVKLAKIFGVEVESEVDIEEIRERNEKLERLRTVTSDDEILKNVDLVAFSQCDIDIAEDSDIIYLFGQDNVFRIPYGLTGKKYIGINNPTVEIKCDGEIDLEGQNIAIVDCRFTEETQNKFAIKESADTDMPEENTNDVDGSYKKNNKDLDYIVKDIMSLSVKGAKGDSSSFSEMSLSKEYLDKLGFDNDDPNDTVLCNYENMLIHISPINNEDELNTYAAVKPAYIKFKNCIFYMESEPMGDFLENELHFENEPMSYIFAYPANFRFEDCTFLSDVKYDIVDELNSELISVGPCNNELNFIDCLFININYFISYGNYDDSITKINFKGCHFIDCYKNLIVADNPNESNSVKNRINVTDCLISQRNEVPFFDDDDDRLEFLSSGTLFNTSDSQYVSLFSLNRDYELNADNILIVQEDDVVIDVFRNKESSLTNCQYHNDPEFDETKEAIDDFFDM